MSFTKKKNKQFHVYFVNGNKAIIRALLICSSIYVWCVAEAVHFIESRAIREQRGNAPVQNDYTQNNYQSAPVNNEATPYDFGNSQTTNVVDDPFKDFGDEIKIGDNELPF